MIERQPTYIELRSAYEKGLHRGRRQGIHEAYTVLVGLGHGNLANEVTKELIPETGEDNA